MANSFPASGEAYADAETTSDQTMFSVRTAHVSNTSVIQLNQKGQDGQIKVMAAGDNDVSLISGYDGTPTYFLSNVGIGTTAPAGVLHAVLGSSDFRIDSGLSDTTSAANYGIGFDDAGSNGVFRLRYDRSAGEALSTSKLTLFNNGGSADICTIQQDGNVGIGTTAPAASDGSARTLHIGSNLIIQDVVGTQTMFANNAHYDGAWKQFADGENAVAMRFGAAGTINFHIASELSAGATLSSWDTTDIKLSVNASGDVGIGMGASSPSYKLEVTGSFYSSGSSVDFKKHVTDMAIDSSAIYDLNPVSYEYKKDYKDFGYNLAGGKQVGLLSEDVAKTVPELAIMKDGKAQNVDYQKLSVLLLAEMKKLNKRLETLETNNG